MIWSDHLSADDWGVIRRVAPLAGVTPDEVRTDVGALTKVLAHPAAFESVFGGPTTRSGSPCPRSWRSPSSSIAAGSELQHVDHVDEWVGPRRRLPVFSGGDLREFLGSPANRLFVTELLASYTRVASGAVWVHTRRGWRRRRFSELDPVRLASLLEVVPDDGASRGLPPARRPRPVPHRGVSRPHRDARLGALTTRVACFRLSGLGSRSPRSPASTGAVELLERLGQRWYQLATRTASVPTASMQVVADVGGRFGLARRTLNYLADRHLFVRAPRLVRPTPDLTPVSRRRPSSAATSSALELQTGGGDVVLEVRIATPCRG